MYENDWKESLSAYLLWMIFVVAAADAHADAVVVIEEEGKTNKHMLMFSLKCVLCCTVAATAIWIVNCSECCVDYNNKYQQRHAATTFQSVLISLSLRETSFYVSTHILTKINKKLK